MRVLDLVDRELPLAIGGRSFLLRRIRLRTVVQILVRFSDQLSAFARSEKRDADKLMASLENDELADLLALLLVPYDGDFLRKNLSLEIAQQVTSQVMLMNDVARIWTSLSFSKEDKADLVEAVEPGEPGLPEIPALLAVIDLMAERYKQDPLRIMEWPYEAFLTMVDVLDARVKGAEREQLRKMLEALGVSPELIDQPGVTFAPVPKQKLEF